MLYFVIIIAIILYFVIKNKREREEQERQRRIEEQRIRQKSAELNAFLERKRKVIESSKLYPHAFYELTQKLHIAEIPGTKIILPGTRIRRKTEKQKTESNNTKRDTFKQQGRAVLMLSRKIVLRQSIPTLNNNFVRHLSLFHTSDGIGIGSSTMSGVSCGRSINSLSKDEYETIFHNIDILPNREKILKEELHKEDIEIEFENKVLCNKKRLIFYKQFLAGQQNVTDEKEFCVSNLFKLDSFISSKSREEYARIKREYPKATKYFESIGFPTNDSTEELVAANEDRIIEINKVVDRYYQLKEKYPVGLPAFEKDYAWYDGILYTELTIEQIVECEDEIAKYEVKKADDSFYKHWQETQNDFNTKCLKIRDSSLSDWWCYSYKVPLLLLLQKNSKPIEISVWQIFYESYSEDETVNTSFYPEKASNREKIPQLLNNLKQYPHFVYSKILSFVVALKNSYPQENITVLFSCSQTKNNSTIIEAHFDYLKTELDNRNIPNYIITESTKYSSGKQKYVIVDLVTGNSNLKRNVSRIIQSTLLYRNSIRANKNDKHSYYADIVYISLLKGFDKDEMLSLNDKKRIEEENEIRRKRNEENRIKTRAESIYNNYRKGFVYYANLGKIKSWNSCSSISDYQKIIEFESQCRIKHEELQKKDRLNQLKGCVKDWHVTRYGIAHDYIYGYLKTSAPREASESEWDIRNLIWAFKNDPGKVNQHYSYNQALDIIIPKYERELKNTFGNYLSDLTLVCIPASSSIKNKRRWEEFAQRVCRDLDMRNAYDYIKITSEAVPRHLGGDGQPSLSFDSAFFKGKYVVLCDDIKTTGASLQRMRERIESLGAEVICSLTIGKTIHE